MSTSHQQEHDTPSEKDNWFIKCISSTWGIILLFAIIVSMCWFYPLWLPEICTSPPDEHATFGTYGDQYGALNTLFSGLAFAGLTIAIFLQRKDLKLQREEMREARIEAEKQTKEAEAQTDLMAEQTLSTSLFSHLEIMRNEKKDIVINLQGDSKQERTGDAAILLIATRIGSLISCIYRLDSRINSRVDIDSSLDKTLEWGLNKKAIPNIQHHLRFLKRHQQIMDNWMIPVYLCIRRITHSNLSDIKKQEYVLLLFDHFTPMEKVILLVYATISNKSIRLKKMDRFLTKNVIRLICKNIRKSGLDRALFHKYPDTFSRLAHGLLTTPLCIWNTTKIEEQIYESRTPDNAN